ncbi:acyltransferase domain-containing protein [Streptomyces parvulus]|uniref:acyltransferase domain-containing protein n=1 Tax=Streptomyces parvulus TaxID=146923 RepID=UPI0037B6EA5E
MNQSAETWLRAPAEQPSAGGVPDPAPVTEAEARERMTLSAVPPEHRAPVLATLPDADRHPLVLRALLACHRSLFGEPGPPPARLAWPHAPSGAGDLGRYFYLHLFLLALPAALERQRRHGIPGDVVEATFADVGGKMTVRRHGPGTGGFDRQRWVVRHFRGTLHRLGRLQFERARLDTAATGGGPGPDGPAHGDAVLDVHVIGDGPLTPGLCTASFEEARAFYARHFPAYRHRHAVCSSWLLAPGSWTRL